MSLYTVETYGRLQPHLGQEWLLTNGRGGFAMGTVVGCNTRRYHGLLCAATLPPVGRVMALNRVGEVLCFDGADIDDPGAKLHELAVNQFRDRFHPRGEQYLRRFELDDSARWDYEVEGVRVHKEVQVLWGQNVAAVRYTVDPPDGRRVQLALLPFVGLRDFHAERRADGARMDLRAGRRACAVADGANPGGHDLHLWSDAGRFVQRGDWWFGHVYAVETFRGLGDHEDLYQPGRFVLETDKKATITLWAELAPRRDLPDAPPAYAFDAELSRRREIVGSTWKPQRPAPSPGTPGEGGGEGLRVAGRNHHPNPLRADRESGQEQPSLTIQRLARAANDFVVYRKSPTGEDGTTVIAGYPWFADWGRDTMISLPGLLLVTGRFAEARQVLSVFASYVSEGMIPNRFNDYDNTPEYNTVDASLWFVHAAHEYARLSKDSRSFEETLLPACRKIVDGYRNGTRYGIRMDPADGLVTQGDANTQLTWMDAKCDGVAFTPRQGKAVEINALWYHALVLMGERDLAAKVRESFRKAFWISPFRGLADVVDGARRDAAIRPNQIFAVSLPNSPLTDEQQAAVVEVVRRELLTPVGLRTLARSDPNFKPHYSGAQVQRDAAYHNGTIWPWPAGAFLEAYLRVNRRSPESVEQARRWLEPLVHHLEHDACLGSVSEIFEAAEPHRPDGCPAQAWSVAEALRLAVELGM
ncbi:MAG: GH133 / GH13_25 [uncultured Phycisphaerae bacterium]|uniref:GH133 / GH13_25 n=1 Tax=uncultured Phycisphaerae bacterium TaxID=904963 RepID=A0A6J4NSW0_9BACT|nr:MAG: GH133 / GH13_25 [uncultured Phycisphaerae bacterium]